MANNRLHLNLSLILFGLVSIYSGFVLMIDFHMGSHGTINQIQTHFSLSYSSWALTHKIGILIFSSLLAIHLILNHKFYSIILRKRLFKKNKQIIILSTLFIIVAISGYLPWLMSLRSESNIIRKILIEIHDKFSIIFSIYLILHVVMRIKRILK